MLIVGLTDVEDLDDVGVMKGRGKTRLIEKHANELRVVGVVAENAFQDHELLELLDAFRLGQINLGHSSHGESADELVFAQPNPGPE